MFSHSELIVFDTEWTSWPGFKESGWKRPGCYLELIQVGAVAVTADHRVRELRTFERIVKPVFNPVLSDYIIDLTGITQERVDREGVSFENMLADFTAFAGDDVQFVSYGRDDEVLELNCGYRDVPFPDLFRNCVDLRAALVSGGYAVKGGMSSDLANNLESEFAGRAHNALDDARLVSMVMRKYWSQLHAADLSIA